MAETWNKKERENKKRQQQKEKEERKKERKEQAKNKGESNMIAYLDENGNLSSTPPDPKKRKVIELEQIEIGVPKHAPIDPSEAIKTGILTFFNNSKGFGFVKDAITQESYFMHISGMLTQVEEGNKVIFELEKGPRGLQAINVKLA
jgi:cold shock CspA family protein